MLPDVEIETTPDLKALAKNIRKISRGLTDWRPVWRLLLPDMIRMSTGHFKSGGASTGKRWPPSKRPGKATMILSGALVGAMGSKSNALRFLTRKAVGIAPDVGRYPFMLHYGAKKAGRGGRGGYPPRPFLVWDDATTRKAEELADQFVKQQVEKIQTGLKGL